MKFALATILSIAALPALADEVWSTDQGKIVYETVLDGGMSVFTAPARLAVTDAPADAVMRIYIPALANSDGARGFHEAFWMAEGLEDCALGLTAPDGHTSTAWGRAQLAFDAPSFPSGFTLILGYCGWDPFIPVRAEPDLG